MNTVYRKPIPVRNVVYSLALIAILWVSPWLLWWTVGFPRAARPAPALLPVVRYMRTSDVLDGSAGSPVLCILPTKWGFSMLARENEQNVFTFLKPPVESAVFLARLTNGGALPPVGQGLVSDPRDTRQRYEPRPAEPLVAMSGTGGVHGVQIDMTEGGLKDCQFAASGVLDNRIWELAEPWTLVTAWVELNARGRVAHVFLESTSGRPAVDRAVVRALYAGTAGRPGTACMGRVRIAYLGRSDEHGN